MSTCTWINYGIGLCTSSLTLKSVEAIEKLLTKAPSFRQEIHEFFKECGIDEPEIQDYVDYDEDYHNGIAYILKEVIEEREGVFLTACDDVDGNDYLIFPQMYPWELNWKERRMTRRKVERLLKKYLSIITEDPLDIDDIQAENYG